MRYGGYTAGAPAPVVPLKHAYGFGVSQSGVKDGLLTHSLPPEFWPKIFYMNSEYEYYGRAASLIHINMDGKSDAKLAANTRIYFFAGGQHSPAAFPPMRQATQNLPNP